MDFEKEIERMKRDMARMKRNDRILYLVVATGVAIVIGLVLAAFDVL